MSLNNPHVGSVGRTTIVNTDEALARAEQEIADRNFGELGDFDKVEPTGDVHDPADDCEASHS